MGRSYNFAPVQQPMQSIENDALGAGAAEASLPVYGGIHTLRRRAVLPRYCRGGYTAKNHSDDHRGLPRTWVGAGQVPPSGRDGRIVRRCTLRFVPCAQEMRMRFNGFWSKMPLQIDRGSYKIDTTTCGTLRNSGCKVPRVLFLQKGREIMEQSSQFLGTKPIGTLMRRYALPCVISLLVGARITSSIRSLSRTQATLALTEMRPIRSCSR